MHRLFETLSALYKKTGHLLLGAAALALILCVLFCGDNIGLSDNGDFARVLAASSLSGDGEDGNFYYVDEYTVGLTENTVAGNLLRILFETEGLRDYPSLQVAVVRLSVVLNLIYNQITGAAPSVYRLGMLGVLYSLLYATVLAFLFAQFHVKRLLADFVLKCLIIIVLCDVGYVAYFNSLYGEALQIISLVFCGACLLRVLLHPPGRAEIVLCAVAAVVFGWSKFFNVPAAALIAAALEGIIFIRTKRKAAVVCGALSVAVLGAVLAAVPPWMDSETTYNAVFFGVVKDVGEAAAERYLSDLGLPAEAIRFRDTNYYVEGVPAALAESGCAGALASLSKPDLLLFYLKHPARLRQQMDIVVLNSGFLRPYYLSNYGGTFPRPTLSHRFSLWSDLRLLLSFDSRIGLVGVYAAFLSALLLTVHRRKRHWAVPALALSAALFLYGFVAPIVLGGEGDIAKHMFLFAQLTDMAVLFVIAAAMAAHPGHRFGLRQAGCAVMAACLAVLPVKNGISNLLEETRTHAGLEAGAYVALGEYGGKGLVWRVTEMEDASATLLCADTLGGMRFSESGGNAWEAASLRAFLNGPFLGSFSREERGLIQNTENSVLLTRGTKGSATSGSRDFYCTQIPSLSARGYALAYQTKVSDLVTLPDIRMISELAAQGADISMRGAYWLRTPYFNNGCMVRCVFPDGYVYFRQADEPAAVRPVIHIAVTDIIAGSGSASDPFILMSGS